MKETDYWVCPDCLTKNKLVFVNTKVRNVQTCIFCLEKYTTLFLRSEFSIIGSIESEEHWNGFNWEGIERDDADSFKKLYSKEFNRPFQPIR